MLTTVSRAPRRHERRYEAKYITTDFFQKSSAKSDHFVNPYPPTQCWSISIDGETSRRQRVKKFNFLMNLKILEFPTFWKILFARGQH